MPQLQDDFAALGMDGVRDSSPARDLRVGVDPRRKGVTFALLRNLSGLRDDQSRRGALGVILDVHIDRRVVRGARAAARQRRHKHAIRERKGAHLDRLEELF